MTAIMEYTTLGSTGMEVSKICLGCMSFDSKDWDEWVLEEECASDEISDGLNPNAEPLN